VLSVTITAAVMALTPLRTFSFAPLTDSWGLFIETLCIAAGILAMKRGQAWLIPWTIAMLVLSFTRDSTLVLLIAALVLLIHRRTQRTLQLFVTGVVASIPAFAIFGAPLRTNLALKVANDHVPTPSQASTEAILHHYPGFVWALVKGDLAYVHHHPLVGLVFVAGLALLFLPSHPGADDEWAFLRAGVLGGVVSLLAIPHGSEGRLELVFVPFVACGLARFQRPINNALRRRPLAFASALARGRRSTV
jgi:hypothetical protein